MFHTKARTLRRLLAVLATAVLLGGCGVPSAEPDRVLRILVPSQAGGGYDLTARSAAQVLRADGIAHVDVFNVVGSGGITGLNRVVLEVGNPDLLLMMGLSLVGALRTQPSQHALADATPVARLLEEPVAVLVAADSPLVSFPQFAEQWVARPESVALGGGSAVGGFDHLVALQVADALEVSRRDLNYQVFDGGGALLPALLTGQIDAAVSGTSEYIDQIRAGAVRVLAVSGSRRSPAVDAPALQELGLPVEAVNWRGLYAPPGLGEQQMRRLTDLVEQLRDSPQWREVLQRNGWTDAYLAGEEFARYVTEQEDLVAQILGPAT